MPASARRSDPPAPARRAVARSDDATREDVLYAEVLRAIRAGELAGGAALPSLRELAASHGTSVFTAQRAVRRLAAEGAVLVAHGSGARVASPASAAAGALARPSVSLIGEVPPPGRIALERMGAALPQWILHHLAADARLRVAVGATAPGVAHGLASRIAEARALGARVVVLLDERFEADGLAAIAAARADGMRTVYVATHVDIGGADRVESDFAGGQRELTLALAAAGRRSPLRLALRESPLWERGRAAGFAAALRELGLGAAARRTVRVDHALHDPRARVAMLASVLGPAIKRMRADAVLALSDADALFTRAALARLGRADVLVAGYDATWDEQVRFGLLDAWREALGADGDAVLLGQPPPSVDRDLPAVAAAIADLAARRALGDGPRGEARVVVPQRLVLPMRGGGR